MQAIESFLNRFLKLQLFDHTMGKQYDVDFQLVGVVCYYGKHYSTFLYYSKRKEWVSCDDSSIIMVSSVKFLERPSFKFFIKFFIVSCSCELFKTDDLVLIGGVIVGEDLNFEGRHGEKGAAAEMWGIPTL